MKLNNEGAEVFYFDMDDPTTHAAALEGCHGLFVVTNYWEHFSIEKEKAQAKSIAESAIQAGIQHIVWSTLEGTTDFFNSLEASERPNKIGNYYVPHFDGKHESDQYFPLDKTTKLFTSFYLENLAGTGMVQNGVLRNNMGDSPLPVIGCSDIGKCAYGIFKAGPKYVGKNVYVAGDIKSCTRLMDIASDVTQKQFEYRYVDRDTYANLDFPGANDLANMFDFYIKSNAFVKNRHPNKAKELNPELLSARSWMEKNVDVLSKLAASPDTPSVTTATDSTASKAEAAKSTRTTSKTKVAPATATTSSRRGSSATPKKSNRKSTQSKMPVSDVSHQQEEEVWC